MSESEEFLTIAEAAARLGIHQRQARRYADRLQNGERTPAGQSPLMVRMSSLERLCKAGQRTHLRSGTGTGQAGQERTGVREEAKVSAQQIASIYEALIVEKDARIRLLEEDRKNDRQEIARLREQLLITAAPAPPPAGQAEDSGPDPGQADQQLQEGGRRPWWKFWR